MKELVHERDIRLRTYDLGGGRIRVEGHLRDHRHRSRSGEEAPPILVHDMIARWTVYGPEMRIESVDAEMPRYPRKGCDEAIPWMQRLVGERIVSGFTQRLKDMFGDTKGCNHLTSLFIAMGPAAVQGVLAAYGLRRAEEAGDRAPLERVINTCHLWREDGPLVKTLMRSLKEQPRESADR